MTINERFTEAIKTLFSGNKRAFSNAIGVSPSVIENIVGSRKGNPSYEIIEKVCANANISPEWLITGKGKMLNEPLKASVSGNGNLVLQGSNTLKGNNIDNRQYHSDSPDVLRAQIDDIDKLLREKDQRLSEKDQYIQELKETTNERLREKDEYIQELKETIRELKNK